MANRITIYEGYNMPDFGKYKSRRRGLKKMATKMKTCARKWKSSGKRGKYVSFMKSCLKSR